MFEDSPDASASSLFNNNPQPRVGASKNISSHRADATYKQQQLRPATQEHAYPGPKKHQQLFSFS